MRLEKHVESLEEVFDEIETALSDSRGLIRHQRRLVSMISIGMCDLIEIYFHKLEIMKAGTRIQHDWFRKRDIKERLQRQIIIPLEKIKDIEEIIKICQTLENSRDNLVYGSPVSDEKILKAGINLFLDIKTIIQKEIGDVLGKE